MIAIIFSSTVEDYKRDMDRERENKLHLLEVPKSQIRDKKS